MILALQCEEETTMMKKYQCNQYYKVDKEMYGYEKCVCVLDQQCFFAHDDQEAESVFHMMVTKHGIERLSKNGDIFHEESKDSEVNVKLIAPNGKVCHYILEVVEVK